MTVQYFYSKINLCEKIYAGINTYINFSFLKNRFIEQKSFRFEYIFNLIVHFGQAPLCFFHNIMVTC